jgi:hypothetical protein
MRVALITILLLSPTVAAPCVIDEEIPASVSSQGPLAMRLYRFQGFLKNSDAVFEGEAESLEHIPDDESPTTKATIHSGRVWKTDGGDLSIVSTSATSCGAKLQVGSRYVFFGTRHHGFWSFLPWVEDPITVGSRSVVWLGPYRDISPEDLAFHREISLDLVAKVLNAPELGDTPSNYAAVVARRHAARRDRHRRGQVAVSKRRADCAPPLIADVRQPGRERRGCRKRISKTETPCLSPSWSLGHGGKLLLCTRMSGISSSTFLQFPFSYSDMLLH